MFKKIIFLGMLTASLLMGCGGGSGGETRAYTVGGTVEGLGSGQQVTLLNNGGDSLVLGNGTFTFKEPIAHNGSYAITVDAQPTGQTCTVSNHSGSGMVANVSDVVVTCSTNTYTVGGTVTGLASGQQVTLKNNGADALTLNSDGGFSFATPVAYNGSYAITVDAQPTGQTCTVSNHSRSGMVANVSDVVVTCSTITYTVGGTVTGLASSEQVTLKNNGADALTLTSNGGFSFLTPVVHNGPYAVTVSTQLNGVYRRCSVANGAGTATAKITNVTVTCGDVAGSVTTLAGSGTPGTADGTGTAASFSSPYGIAIDVAGNLYVADSSNNRIRKIDAGGQVTTVAGSGTPASFNLPTGAVVANGNLYVADYANHRIRKIDAGGNVTTVAGSGTADYVNGTGTAASFNNPQGIAVDVNGNLYVADFKNQRIRKIAPSGQVTTVAGSSTPGYADGTGTAASFYNPSGITVDVNGNLYVADSYNNKIRKIVPANP